MSFATEDPRKVNNIVSGQIANFRRLYAPLIETLPNVAFNDSRCSHPDWVDDPDANVRVAQDMDPVRRGNMVRRLPKSFREKLYFQYQSRFKIPRAEFNKMMSENTDEDPERIHRRQGGKFEQKIAGEEHLKEEVSAAIKKTISWPSVSQSIKGIYTAGLRKTWRYLGEKRQKFAESKGQLQIPTEDSSTRSKQG
jgi:translocator assembly and maintenance protein 41